MKRRKDLISKPGASLVVAGPHQPVVVQLMVYAMNAALKNLGTTLLLRSLPPSKRTSSILQLASDIDAGRVQQLFIFGGDPGLQRAAFDHSGSQNEACRSTGPTCRSECPMSLGWVTTRMRPRL